MRTKSTAIGFAIPVVLLGSLIAGYCDDGGQAQHGWKNEMVAGFNLTLASFDNWAQGGETTLGWQVGLAGEFTNLGPKHEWLNTIKLAYGMQKVGDQESRKSVDDIKLETVLTYKADFYVDIYVAGTAETQFSKGYEYTDLDRTAVSNFMDPGYFTQSIGVGRTYDDVVRSRLGFSVKETVTDTYPAPYTDDPETDDEIETTKVELGLESVTDLNLKISENLLFTSKLGLFSDLEASNRIDVRWDNLLTAKVEKYLSVTINVVLFYDRDISTKRQLKQSLAIGLTYTLL